ncbi:protein S100-B-like [Trichomycterus rosablanca]|uniref:protein S100-B-like n=1 Tax=Trichomycterus rosablanca TaxID=2290929 RepID=UPI002F35CFD2
MSCGTLSSLLCFRSMTELERAMATIVQVFYKYSGHKSTLKKADLKHLINYEMSQFIKKIQKKEALDMLFNDLDQNGDLEIDFQEFVPFIAMVTAACHDLVMSKHLH